MQTQHQIGQTKADAVLNEQTLLRSQTIGLNARQVISRRYSRKDEEGEPIEDWRAIVERVVGHVARAEQVPEVRAEFTRALTEIMLKREFLPNTPCLVNAGKPDGMLAACFVLPVPDSIKGIMEHAKSCAIVHQQGGGTGMTYEFLRPAGALVGSTRGVASGPVSFMNIVNQMTEVVKQGGVRRGANMSMLRVTHPDVLRFIHGKNDQDSFVNFNISVTLTDDFLRAADAGRWFQLEFDGQPWTKPIYDPVTEDDYAIYIPKADHPITADSKLPQPVAFCDRASFLSTDLTKYEKIKPSRPGMVYAPDVWNRIVLCAHKYGEPGICFIDEVNRHNLLMKSMGPIYSSNPCSEQMLHFNNSCNLGSIDLAKFYTAEKGIELARLKETVHCAVRFLDNVIDICVWPLPEIEETVKRTRPVGLGVMGFADLCLLMKITYGSDESIKLMEDVLGFIRREGWIASCNLGREKGVFPELAANYTAYRDLLLKLKVIDAAANGHDHVTPRNYQVTNVAPTGTISLAAETSSGIEPNFEFAYIRQDTVGTRKYAHPLAARALGFEVDQSSQASIDQGAAYVMEHRAKLPAHFVTAMEIAAEKHVLILAAAQRNVDNAVSKTVNGAATDTVESVDALYRLARQLRCKAVSYYRDGSRENQVLTTIKQTAAQVSTETSGPEPQPPLPVVDEELSERAPDRRDRPRELTGTTWQIEFEGHNLYVTVNHDAREILEIFATGPISSSVGKLASKMLRGGFNAREVAQTLNTTTGTHAVWFNERLLTSPEQAIAECILMMQHRLASQTKRSPTQAAAQKTDDAETNRARTQSASRFNTPLCPHCHEPLNRTGNCWVCAPCAFSKCG